MTGASLELGRELEGAAMQVWKGLVQGSLHTCALAGEKALRIVRWSRARERDWSMPCMLGLVQVAWLGWPAGLCWAWAHAIAGLLLLLVAWPGSMAWSAGLDRNWALLKWALK